MERQSFSLHTLRKWICLLIFVGLQSKQSNSEKISTTVTEALKGLNKPARLARGLQDQCINVYDDLEARARKKGTDYLHKSVSNWHIVSEQDKKFDLISKELKSQEDATREKYQNDIIGLSENLQALDPAKAKKSEILDYQTDMTSLILKLNDLAVKVARIDFYRQIKFLAKANMPCLKAIYSQWESLYSELQPNNQATKTEIKEENQSKLQNLRRQIEGQIRVYEDKIQKLFKIGNTVPELKIRLKDAGFSREGELDESYKRFR